MDDKKFIKHIQDKLSQHRVAVSDDLWEKVSSALPSSPVWYKHPYLYASVAVVAALVIVCCCLYNDCVSSPCTRQDTHQQHLLCSCDTISDIDNRDFIIHLPADSVGIVDCEKKSCKQPSVVLPSMQTQQITDRGRELLAIVGEVDMLDTDTFTVAEVTTSHVIDIDTPLIAYCCNDESQYFDDKAIQSISNSVKNTREQSTFFSFEATTSPCRTVVSPLALRSSDAEVEFSHKMPLAVRALFEKRFGRWGVDRKSVV